MNVEHNRLKNGTSVIVFIRSEGIMRVLTNILRYNYEKCVEKLKIIDSLGIRRFLFWSSQCINCKISKVV